MEMNRYIKAMEIGLANEEKGITYNDLVNEINGALGENMGLHAESTFYYWFVDNFSATNVETKNDSRWKSNFNAYYKLKTGVVLPDVSLETRAIGTSNTLNEAKWFLNGNAAKQYLDYEELQQSRIAANNAQISSKEANRKSNTSIALAIWALAVSAVFGAYAILFPPEIVKPPFDVKIIEDKTNVKQLQDDMKQLEANYQLENKKLKEELYKAEMMVEVLENTKTK